MRQLEMQEATPAPRLKVAVAETPVASPQSLIAWLPILWTRVLFGGAPASATPWSWRPFCAIFLLSGVLLYPCMSFALFEPDEGRYAQIPREMLATGEWIVPTLQGEAYLDKPPLFYWLVMLAYAAFGFSDGVARLVPALAMHATALATYGLGRRLVGERSAFWGTLVLTVSPIALGVGRLLVLDGLLTLWITLALLAALIALDESSFRWWTITALACALGVLTKGPVAILLVVPPLLAHAWLTGKPTAIPWRWWLAFAGVIAIINLPWYIAVCVQRPEFVRYFLWQHNVQRFVEPFDHVRPVWFYVPILLYGLLPLALFAWPIANFLTSLRSEESNQRCPALGYLLLAGLWCVFFFSLAGSKLPTYILPAFPPLCLALGCFVARTDWHRSRWLIGLVTLAWVAQMGVNCVGVPIYAQAKSPMTAEMAARCGDPSVPVVCFPRNVDSVAFYVGRSDFRTFRSKEIDALLLALEQSPRTVVLFGHRNSPETLARNLPPHLRLTERRPMGLCESGIVERIR